MIRDQTVDEAAFRAGKIAARVGHKVCPYADIDRVKRLSWRRGWAEGEVERILQAKVLSFPGTPKSNP